MTRKERLQRIKILEQQLRIIDLYSDHFENIEGKTGVQQRIDDILDELILHHSKLSKNKKD